MRRSYLERKGYTCQSYWQSVQWNVVLMSRLFLPILTLSGTVVSYNLQISPIYSMVYQLCIFGAYLYSGYTCVGTVHRHMAGLEWGWRELSCCFAASTTSAKLLSSLVTPRGLSRNNFECFIWYRRYFPVFLFSALISTAVIFVAMLFLFSQELGVSDVRVKLSNLIWFCYFMDF